MLHINMWILYGSMILHVLCMYFCLLFGCIGIYGNVLRRRDHYWYLFYIHTYTCDLNTLYSNLKRMNFFYVSFTILECTIWSVLHTIWF